MNKLIYSILNGGILFYEWYTPLSSQKWFDQSIQQPMTLTRSKGFLMHISCEIRTDFFNMPTTRIYHLLFLHVLCVRSTGTGLCCSVCLKLEGLVVVPCTGVHSVVLNILSFFFHKYVMGVECGVEIRGSLLSISLYLLIFVILSYILLNNFVCFSGCVCDVIWFETFKTFLYYYYYY